MRHRLWSSAISNLFPFACFPSTVKKQYGCFSIHHPLWDIRRSNMLLLCLWSKHIHWRVSLPDSIWLRTWNLPDLESSEELGDPIQQGAWTSLHDSIQWGSLHLRASIQLRVSLHQLNPVRRLANSIQWRVSFAWKN